MVRVFVCLVVCLVGFSHVCSLSIEHADRKQHWCLLLLGVDLEDWILTAVILDPLIQGLKYADREGPGKTQQALGSQGMGLFWLVEKLQFFIFFQLLFKSGAGA